MLNEEMKREIDDIPASCFPKTFVLRNPVDVVSSNGAGDLNARRFVCVGRLEANRSG